MIRITRRPRHLGCGCHVPAGTTIVSSGKGKPWLCPTHQAQLPLRTIPEVLEAHATSGTGDLHCRVVARTNSDLQEVINRILEVQGIDRSTTVIALSDQIRYRVMPLVEVAAGTGPRRRSGARPNSAGG